MKPLRELKWNVVRARYLGSDVTRIRIEADVALREDPAPVEPITDEDLDKYFGKDTRHEVSKGD